MHLQKVNMLCVLHVHHPSLNLMYSRSRDIHCVFICLSPITQSACSGLNTLTQCLFVLLYSSTNSSNNNPDLHRIKFASDTSHPSEKNIITICQQLFELSAKFIQFPLFCCGIFLNSCNLHHYSDQH